jgi:hypothetical protein
LREIEFRRSNKSKVVVDQVRDIAANIPNQPDGEKASHAVKINLQKTAYDVAIQESQRDFELRIRIAFSRAEYSPAF